ncbi:MYB-like [Penicillium digitatum]|uniref:MYB-like n=1 Tax=Penicillium digitatum TaxID=36651 RepID=A0A7T7BJB2_PENDI|nr:MYB-like [Penicillium digitatum]
MSAHNPRRSYLSRWQMSLGVGTAVPGRQSKKKSSSVGKRHSKVGASRSNKGLHRRSSVSFPIVHAQFSALPVEDRLEFLSWLFEGALSHYISQIPNWLTLSIPLVREKVTMVRGRSIFIGEAQGRTESCLVGGDETFCTEIRQEE